MLCCAATISSSAWTKAAYATAGTSTENGERLEVCAIALPFSLKRDSQNSAADNVYTLGAAHFTHFAYLTAPFYWQSCQYPTPTGGHPPAAAPRRAPSIHTILHDRGPFLQSCKVHYPTPSRGHTQHFGTPDCQNTTYAIIMGYGYVSTPRAWTPTTHRVQ